MAEDFTGQTLLGKYRVVELIGRGGMGTVWRATHALTGRKLAVKVLDERFLSNAGVVQRFGREARAASAVRHPGIVEVLDLDQTKNGVPFLVMELLEGDTLGQRIERRGKLGQAETLEIMTQLLEALDAAHAHGVVHRDLKPDNIVLVPRSKGTSEMVKILDFGISQKDDERVQQLTIAGSVLGTPHYMAPEQALGEGEVDARADVYAAAVVMYECVVGDVPFDGPNYNRLIQIILNDVPVPPRARGAKIDAALEEVILSALAKDRAFRPQSAGAFLELIRAVAAVSPASYEPGRTPISTPPSRLASDRPKPSSKPPLASSLAETAAGTESVLGGASDYDVEGLELDLGMPTPPPRAPTPTPVPPAKIASDPPPDPRAEKHDSAPPSLDPLEAPADTSGLEVDEAAIAGSVRPPRRFSTRPAPSESGGPAPSHSMRPSMGPRSYSPLASRSERPPPAVAETEGNRTLRSVLYFFGLVAIVVGVIFGLRHVVRPEPAPPPEAPRPVAIHADETPAPPPVLRTVEVRVTDLPPGASMLLDGLPVTELPLSLREGTSHRLEISAPGFESRTVLFDAEEDARIDGTLAPAPFEEPRRRRGRKRNR